MISPDDRGEPIAGPVARERGCRRHGGAGPTMPASVFPGLGAPQLSGLPCFRSDVREWTSRGVFADFGEECLWAVRLAHIGVTAGGARLGLDAAERMGGDDNDWDVF